MMESKSNPDNGAAAARRSLKLRTTTVPILLAVILLLAKELTTFSPNQLFRMMEESSNINKKAVSFYPINREDSSDDDSQRTADTIFYSSSTFDHPSYNNSSSIRKWGCHRRETPLIFVHIGKAGGGSIRGRLAGSAEDYNRTNWHEPHTDQHYYPISMETGGHRRAKFCNSKNKNLKVPYGHPEILSNVTKSFEGEIFCNATTPFGMAIACPQNYRTRHIHHYRSSLCLGCDDDYYLEAQHYDTLLEDEKPRVSDMLLNPPPPGHTCDTVYVSHNHLGAELNWLPPRYLKEHWWDHSPWKETAHNHPQVKDQLDHYWKSLLSDRNHRAQKVLKKLNNASLTKLYSENYNKKEKYPKWCPEGYIGFGSKEIQYHRPNHHDEQWWKSENRFHNCSQPIGQAVDGLVREFWKNKSEPPKLANNNNNNTEQVLDENDYSPIYASLPLHRITMLREPWSWLLSKFFWHSLHHDHYCKNIFFTTKENPTMSWIELYSTQYLVQLCGTDCQLRFEHNRIGLEGIEAQAKGNLRNSFSVVGLLNESDSFYEMIEARIDYIDTHKKTKIQLKSHRSSNSRQKPKCMDLFLRNETFREYVRSNIPAVRALESVYEVGVEVNRFQKEELEQCKG